MAPIMLNTTLDDELKKNPDMKPEDLTELKEWISTQKHLPPISDEMVILFHHSNYYRMEQTKDCIDTYYTLRTSTPEFFSNRDITKPDLAKALSALNYTVFPKRDPNGYQIVYHGLKDYDSSKYMFVDGIKLLLMSMDSSLHDTGTSPGIIILFNMQGAKLSHLTRVSLSPIRKFFQYIQDANPVRLQAIHIINVVSFIDTVLTMIKPFMKKELMKLLHFHTGDETVIYQHIPKDCLPKDFGGDLESLEELCSQHTKRLESLGEYFAAEQKLRVDESKRIKGKKNKNGDTEIAFGKLEID